MTSATERATEIWTKLCWDLKEWKDIDGAQDWSGRFVKTTLLNAIAAEIEAAETETAIRVAQSCTGYADGFRAAQERAVEIIKNWNCGDNVKKKVNLELIAERIREMRP